MLEEVTFAGIYFCRNVGTYKVVHEEYTGTDWSFFHCLLIHSFDPVTSLDSNWL